MKQHIQDPNADEKNQIFREVAENTKQRLAVYIGRPFIRSNEWSILKAHKFPFETYNIIAIITGVDICSLNVLPLVNILESKYGEVPTPLLLYEMSRNRKIYVEYCYGFCDLCIWWIKNNEIINIIDVLKSKYYKCEYWILWV